eukprot:scaffold198145_cov21-Prasinocladus_malaysianus.AAC.1
MNIGNDDNADGKANPQEHTKVKYLCGGKGVDPCGHACDRVIPQGARHAHQAVNGLQQTGQTSSKEQMRLSPLTRKCKPF